MPPKPKSSGKPKTVATLRHDDARRKNLPTAEYEPLMRPEDKSPIQVAYERRNRDLDPQLVWRGKDIADWSDLVVPAPPLYIQEKVHPKVLIDDLLRQSQARAAASAPQIDLFADFNGLPHDARATEFYQHDANWTNRLILGDSLHVMASLAEREGLRGKVQCIYFDPPYGIKFNSNFQWSTTSRDVTDGKADHITREPEQVKAFRDTWRDGIHSYLTYLRDRLTVARDLLADSGSIFVQIGDENVHRVRSLLDELLGEGNFVSQVVFRKTTGKASGALDNTCDYLLWFAKDRSKLKFRPSFESRAHSEDMNVRFVEEATGLRRAMTQQEADETAPLPAESRAYRYNPLTSARPPQANDVREYTFQGQAYSPGKRTFSTNLRGLQQLDKANRLHGIGNSLTFVRYFADFAFKPRNDIWDDTRQSGFGDEKLYVVQTASRAIERCLLMTTDPGDLVLDPTCGSGTTAYVAEQWGRRWITIDTSRVALALARARIMGARYPFYLLADSPEGQRKEAEVTRTAPRSQPTHGNLRHGFVYERVPHITLKSIANNAEIDVIWDKWQQTLEPLREQLNQALGRLGSAPASGAAGGAPAAGTKPPPWQEWEIPREFPPDLCRSRRKEAQTSSGKDQSLVTSAATDAEKLHAAWWEARIARQKEIDASIAAKAEFEFLYDKPYEDKSKVRVAGPFTVETLSPHRTLTVDENDNIVDGWKLSEKKATYGMAGTPDFATVILENLRLAGVQQAHKEDRITFTSLVGWPGEYIGAEGRYFEDTSAGSSRRKEAPTEIYRQKLEPPHVGCYEAQDEGGRGKTKSAPAAPTEPTGAQKRAAIFIGPEFGTVSRPDLVAAAREAADAGFDLLIACAFNYDAHSAEFEKLGKIPVLKARMNPDLHMAGDLKNTGAGNLFVVFGEPDIELRPVPPPGRAALPRRLGREAEPQLSPTKITGKAGESGPTASPDLHYVVEVKGVDVFKPQTGEVVSAGPEGIACWMIDTDYNEESFFVRHAYFLGQNDPYSALKTTLKAEIDQEAWQSLHSAISRPFPKPTTGRIAVKVINHLGDEVMKVFAVK